MMDAARAVLARRELLLDFAWRDLRSRYKGSVLGFAWNFLIPVLQLVVFWILFGVLLSTRPLTATGEKPYPIFLLVGLLPWTYFANALQGGAASIVANAAIVKRVRMPLELLPAAAVLSALVNFVLALLVAAAVLALFGPRHPEGLVFVPLLILVQTVLALGLAYVLAAANVFFRDVEHILGVLLMAWYFLTPVLFPISVADDRPVARALLELNPMTGVIVGWQRALLDGLAPEWGPLLWSLAVGTLLLVAGFAWFTRAKDGFEAAL